MGTGNEDWEWELGMRTGNEDWYGVVKQQLQAVEIAKLIKHVWILDLPLIECQWTAWSFEAGEAHNVYKLVVYVVVKPLCGVHLFSCLFVQLLVCNVVYTALVCHRNRDCDTLLAFCVKLCNLGQHWNAWGAKAVVKFSIGISSLSLFPRTSKCTPINPKTIR